MKTKKSFDENNQRKNKILVKDPQEDSIIDQIELLADIIVSQLLIENNDKYENRLETRAVIKTKTF